MRKIERDMNDAIARRQDWRSGNTKVLRCYKTASSHVYLHDNFIAEVFDDGRVEPNESMFVRWTTPTTASRLRALGVNASIRNFEPYINGVKL